ncbi:MAG: hypothetical protein WDZ90_01380 [Candidatus Paceibacterota bacterium]
MSQSLNIELLFHQIYLLFKSDPDLSFEDFETLWSTYIIFATLLVLLMLTGIIYTHIRFKQVKEEYKEKMKAMAPQEGAVTNKHWNRVLEFVSSENPSDWRQAVLEADVMLNDLLDERGYLGDGVGEKLKSVVAGDFRTLNQAWEGHKIRNQIAHGGGDFLLTKREAKRAIENFEQVFREFGKV